MGSVNLPNPPISLSVNLARSKTEFSLKKSAVTFLVVASSASAFAPFSQYSPKGDRSSSGSGQAQLGQSKPPNSFILNKALVPLRGIFSFRRSLNAAMTAGTPAADLDRTSVV